MSDLPLSGRRAWAVALLGLTLPFVAVQLQTRYDFGSYDTLPVVATVVQVRKNGTRDLSAYTRSPHYTRWAEYPAPPPFYFAGPVPTRPGLYSAYPAGMEVFAWPVVAAADLLGADLDDEWTLLRLEQVSAALTAGLALALFFLAALRFGSPAAAYVTAALVGTGSVWASTTGMMLWQHGGVVFWTLVLLVIEVQPSERRPRGGTLIQGVACAMMLACRPAAAAILLPFGLWVLIRDRRRGLLLPLAAGLAYLPWAWLYLRIYGDPLGPQMRQAGGFGTPFRHAVGVLVSPARGLFVYQPWAWFLALYATRAVRSPGGPPGFAGFAVGAFALQLLLVGSWWCWWGGHCWGSRLMAEVVPLLGLLAVRPVERLLASRGGRAVLVAVGLAGVAAHVPYQFFDGWTWNWTPAGVDEQSGRLWDWRHPPFLHYTR